MERAHPDLRFFRASHPSAYLVACDFAHKPANELVVDLVEDIQSFHRQARLARVPEASNHCSRDRLLDVRIVAHDHWVGTTKLQSHSFEITTCDGGYVLASSGLA